MNTPSQQELFARRDRATSVSDIQLLSHWLLGRGWQKAAVIQRALGWTDRKIRAVANESRGEVISGQRGYRLAAEATRDELQHAANWLRHQSKAMCLRAIAIENYLHGRNGT